MYLHLQHYSCTSSWRERTPSGINVIRKDLLKDIDCSGKVQVLTGPVVTGLLYAYKIIIYVHSIKDRTSQLAKKLYLKVGRRLESVAC